MEKRALFGFFMLLLHHKLTEVVFRRLKKKVFVRLVCVIVALLFIIRLLFPSVNKLQGEGDVVVDGRADSTVVVETIEVTGDSVSMGLSLLPSQPVLRQNPRDDLHPDYPVVPVLDFGYKHRILSVPSYRDCFPDVQDVQYPSARANGVRPVANRQEAEERKSELLFVGSNPYYTIDPAMSRSIPYLVPRASQLLQHIGRRFIDSLAVKGIPLHTLIVTSLLRTEEDVQHLRRINGNASEQSCHRFGTTFDISYNRYHTVTPPGEAERRAVRNDTLKFVLSEVLRDARAEGRCFVKYEVKQGCFHITVR